MDGLGMSKKHLVVVLRFAETTIIDIILCDNQQQAIAEFAGRALAAGHKLPLVESMCAEVPRERMAALLGLGLPEVLIAKAQPIPIRGLTRAVQVYQIADEEEDARVRLNHFFDIYDVTIDYTGAPLRQRVTKSASET